jgi:large subunit ribosomal protein L24
MVGSRKAAGSWKLVAIDMSHLATPIRKNDTVLVITGKDRGKRGRVLKILPDRNRLVVEGVNMIKRHTKPNPGKNVKGGIVEREASLHASNVQLVCPECGIQTRVGRKNLGDGRKVRICRKCEGVVDK